jgi:K+-sensing histidine kinase KdpD
MNVLHNALKLSPTESTVTIAFERSSTSCLQIAIQDQGPGIAHGEHSKVFDRFYTSCDRATAGTSGVGLGLAIAKLVIERAGGRIRFDEDFQQGAKCLIDLPVSVGFD